MGQFTSAFGNPMLQQMLQQIIQQGQPQQGMGMGGVQRPQMQQPQMLLNQPPASFAPSTMYGDGQFRPGEFNMQTMVDIQNAMGMGSPTSGIGMQPLAPQAMINPVVPTHDVHSLAPNPGNTSQPLGTFVNQTNPANRLLGAKPMKMKGML
jgi:hypothetical protein